MSSPWAAPDARLTGAGTAFSSAPAAAREPAPPVRRDVWAGLLTVAVTVLVGAPLGLLWAELAPSVLVEVRDGQVQVLDTYGDGFIAVDACFLAAVLVAGVVGGALAERLGRRHGPAVVVGLALGGLAAGWVAMAVGEMVGADAVRALVESGAEASTELNVELRSTPAIVAWPVASLLTYLVLAVRR